MYCMPTVALPALQHCQLWGGTLYLSKTLTSGICCCNCGHHAGSDARGLCSSALQAAGRVTVLNTGNGIPVEMHKEEGVYVPELIFGHLLTSSNYDDNEKKVKRPQAADCVRFCMKIDLKLN